MIFPFHHMRFTGVIWYQGEANADNATSYACRFPAMIADWRRQFDLPDLTFFYVELAAYADDGNNNAQITWPLLRAAQAAALQLPRVSFATAIDLGDVPSAPDGSIHPRRKYELGRRLSLSVRAMQYNEKDNTSSSSSSSGIIQTSGGPTLDNVHIVKVVQLKYWVVVLHFDPPSSTAGAPDGSLHLHPSADCTACCNEAPFEVLTRSNNGTKTTTTTAGTWQRATFVNMDNARNNELNLLIPFSSVSSSNEILGVRYAWDSYPQCVLYNGKGGPDDHMGIPAAPFTWCAHPSGQGAWTGNACLIVDTNTPPRPESAAESISIHRVMWPHHPR
jgi:Carbohydrate esterase, sialic acid-specific acetylesterase